MNIKDFKSGTLRQEYQYKSFIPEMINHTFTWDDTQINTMLEDATVVSFGKKAHNASKLIEFLYQRPIVNMTDIGRELELAKATVSSLVKDFEKKGILKEITGYERNKFYAFERYLEAYSKN